MIRSHAGQRAVDGFLLVLLGICLATSAWLDLEIVRGELNVPVADAAALLIAIFVGVEALIRSPRTAFGRLRLGPAGSSTSTDAAIALPAPIAYGLFLVVCVAGLYAVGGYPDSVRFFFRKSVFTWLVYGGAVAAVVARMGPARVHGLALVTVGCLAIPCLVAAGWLLGHGWFGVSGEVPHLTGNHKALAVALAPWLPFAWTGRHRHSAVPWLVALGAAAVLLSASKTAWLTAAVGAVLLLRPRWWLVAGAVGALSAAMIAFPYLSGSDVMVDAIDSRMSLNLRAWQMFERNPIVGAGPGTSTVWLMMGPPHWRIDGVEAHGVVQKVGGENGILGLLAYGAFAAWILRGLWRVGFARAARPLEVGACAMGLCAFVNLLFSTEAFTSSHWAALAASLGIARVASSRRT